jgi:histidinol-phosphatase (PHP family)
MIDYHVHLWPHNERAEPSELRLDRLVSYCEQAQSVGVREIALTEHLFRFTQVRDIAQEFWRDEENLVLRDQISSYFDFHATADLDRYVEDVLAAKAAGLPVILGLEVDYYPGAMDAVSGVLANYPFDVLLGSVHWLGTWMFDVLEDEVSMAEWGHRGTDGAWRNYTEALEELAATRTCDVLAHPDLIKVAGQRPDVGLLNECHARIAEAAKSSGMSAEISSAGLHKPAQETYPARDLLAQFHRAGVRVTTASDAHGPLKVGDHHQELIDLAQQVGYRELCGFRNRVGYPIDISGGDGQR